MQPGFVDRRLSPRSKVSQRIRIRPVDPRHTERICATANQSQTGLYFMTATGHYFPGMDVFVTRHFSPGDPINREERAVVVRVESLGGGYVGVAIHNKSLLPMHVLFVCLGNACRSPMAEALARRLAPDAITASSAGLAPLGYICPPTLAVLAEIGISVAGQKSKPLGARDVVDLDLLINMAGRPVGNIINAPTPVEYWDVADPFGCDLTVFRNTRDEIKRRVLELAKRLRASATAR
jgi:protein-tyrosine-phosphatase